jgi:4-amino-4-deoxy-L-arabinose transferase-like glycosyltransferase
VNATPLHTRFPYGWLLLVLLLALGGRALLLLSGSVSFHSDEATVGLMARHILDGARPTFFYGQAYMGSLDAWLIALGFRLFGESVLTIRLVQSGLYLLVVATGFALAWRMSGNRLLALVTGLLLAVPPVNFVLYTTATLGGYNELLLLGQMALLLGFGITQSHAYWRWLALGVVVGLGWWTHGLIAVYALPLAGVILVSAWRERIGWRKLLIGIGLGLVGFILGGLPWWVWNAANDNAALGNYLPSGASTFAADEATAQANAPVQRLLGLLLLGVPALLGFRFPWATDYFGVPVGLVILLLLIVALYRWLRGTHPLRPGGRLLLLGMLLCFGGIYLGTRFQADPTGRYLLPLSLPVMILLASLIVGLIQVAEPGRFTRIRQIIGIALLVGIVGFQAAGQWSAAQQQPGITTSFDPLSHLPNVFDAELIAFLEMNDLRHGYASYWQTMRLAFLSGERLQFSAALPYKSLTIYNPGDNRYPAYAEATNNAERVAFITTALLPGVDAVLEATFAAQGLRYQVEQIGFYTLYYDFTPQRPVFQDWRDVDGLTGQ